MAKPKCSKCDDTGVWETGNNDLPCDCPAGRTALFNVAGVDGQVTGDEIERHFLNGALEPIQRHGRDPIKADELPGRRRA